MPQEVLEPFDIESLTLGELAHAQEASGLSRVQLVSQPYRLMLAVFVQRLRSSGQPPTWKSVSDLHLVDIKSGPSRSRVGSPSPRSSESE